MLSSAFFCFKNCFFEIFAIFEVLNFKLGSMKNIDFLKKFEEELKKVHKESPDTASFLCSVGYITDNIDNYFELIHFILCNEHSKVVDLMNQQYD